MSDWERKLREEMLGGSEGLLKKQNALLDWCGERGRRRGTEGRGWERGKDVGGNVGSVRR